MPRLLTAQAKEPLHVRGSPRVGLRCFTSATGRTVSTAQPRSEDAHTSRSAHVRSAPTGDLGRQEEWNYGALGTALAHHCCVEMQGTRDACVYHLLRRKKKSRIFFFNVKFPEFSHMTGLSLSSPLGLYIKGPFL